MPRIRALLVVVLVLLLLTSAVAGDDDSYEITLDQSVDIPERTLDTDSGEFTVSTVGRYAEDGTVNVTTSGPRNTSYAIRLVDSEERLRQSTYGTSDDSTKFSLDRYSPGTYAIVITNASDAEDVKAAKPFVIYGYTVSHTTSDEVEGDSTLDVELSLDQVSEEVDNPPAGVEVALGNDSTSIRAEATRTSGLNYTAEIDVSSLSPGEYSLYTGVQRDNTVYEYQELTGVNTYSVTVTEATTTTPTPTDTETPTGLTSTEAAGGQPAPTGTATDAPDGTTAAAGTSTASEDTTAPSGSTFADSTQSSTPADPSSENSATTGTPTSAPSSATGVTPTDTSSSTPVSTPVLPDGGILLLCGGLFALLYRVWGLE